eukprot:scaffold10860_cov182-Amphora_coffeaeformis.AAC.30
MVESNSRLTVIKIRHNGRMQPRLDFVCRLFSRRNQIKQRIQQNEIKTSLWPMVLESLLPSPSALFLAMRYVLWATPAGGDDAQRVV